MTSNIFGREQWHTYAVVVAPNTKRVTAAALKCTIVASGVCGLMKEEWKVILYNCEKVRSANHEMKIPFLVCWKRSTEKSSWRCANKERKRVENNQIPRREQKKLDVWILKRTMDRRLWRGLRDFLVSPSSVNEDPVAIRQDFNGEPKLANENS